MDTVKLPRNDREKAELVQLFPAVNGSLIAT